MCISILHQSLVSSYFIISVVRFLFRCHILPRPIRPAPYRADNKASARLRLPRAFSVNMLAKRQRAHYAQLIACPHSPVA